jgi:hypothetical protein
MGSITNTLGRLGHWDRRLRNNNMTLAIWDKRPGQHAPRFFSNNLRGSRCGGRMEP